MNNQLKSINEWVDILIQMVILSIPVVIPLFFWNLTTEFFETPKLLILFIITGILLLLWSVKSILAGKVMFTRTSLDLPIILTLVIFGVSTYFAVAKPQALMGPLPRLNGSLLSFAIYTFFFFALTSNFRHVSLVKQAIYALLGSGAALSILSLTSYAGLNLLSLPWTGGTAFTPTGSGFSTAAILVLCIPFVLIALLSDRKEGILGVLSQSIGESGIKNLTATIITKGGLVLLLTLFMLTIALTGSTVIYIATAAAFALAIFAVPQSKLQKNIAWIIIPVVVAVLAIIMSLSPVGGNKNYLNQLSKNYPKEIQLSFADSWKVSVSAFRDSPFWGTGPGSYQADFTAYKPVQLNNTTSWNIRFDRAFNEYLEFLATMGAPGLIVLLLFSTLFLSAAFKSLSSSDTLLKSVAISGILFIVLLGLHPSTLPLWVIGLFIVAMFMALNHKYIEQLQFGISAVKDLENQLRLRFDILPVIFSLIIAGGLIYSAFQIGNIFIADYHHRQAVNAIASGNGLGAYNELVAAERYNPNADLYRLQLAQTNFALANAIAVAKGPTEASPSGSLTDEDKNNIRTLLSQAVNEGRAATVLNPNSAGSWEILGSLYRQIAGVAENALAFSLDAYGRAIQRDPYNPVLRLNAGGVYYSAKNYDMAIRFFTDAINLKPDYANAYYNLAYAYRDKGDLENAVAIAERAVSLVDVKSPDYQAASALLSDLKSKLEAQNKDKPSDQTALTSPNSTNSNLQNEKLPKVLDLPKPEKITTPSAVKTSPTPKPSSTPTPTE